LVQGQFVPPILVQVQFILPISVWGQFVPPPLVQGQFAPPLLVLVRDQFFPPLLVPGQFVPLRFQTLAVKTLQHSRECFQMADSRRGNHQMTGSSSRRRDRMRNSRQAWSQGNVQAMIAACKDAAP